MDHDRNHDIDLWVAVYPIDITIGRFAWHHRPSYITSYVIRGYSADSCLFSRDFKGRLPCKLEIPIDLMIVRLYCLFNVPGAVFSSVDDGIILL